MKKRSLNLKNFETQKDMSKLRLSSDKLAVVTRKWYKVKEESRLCNFCNLNATEEELDILKGLSKWQVERIYT